MLQVSLEAHLLCSARAASKFSMDSVFLGKGGMHPCMQTPQQQTTANDQGHVCSTGNPITAAARMRYFRQEANRGKHRFDSTHVWTFTLYQVRPELQCLSCLPACIAGGWPSSHTAIAGPT